MPVPRRATGSRGRIRTLKREFFESPTVMSLPSFRTILTFAGLICCMADDEGRLVDDVDLIKAAVWPKRRDVSPDDVAEDLTAINIAGLIVRYDDLTSGRRGLVAVKRRAERDRLLQHSRKYVCILSWKEHQRISHPTPSKLPPPPAISRSFARTPELFAPDLDLEVEVEKKGSGSGTRARRTRAAREVNGRVSHVPKTQTAAKEESSPAHISDEARDLAEKFRARANGGRAS